MWLLSLSVGNVEQLYLFGNMKQIGFALSAQDTFDSVEKSIGGIENELCRTCCG